MPSPSEILREAGVRYPPVPVLRITKELGIEVRFSPSISYDGASRVDGARS